MYTLYTKENSPDSDNRVIDAKSITKMKLRWPVCRLFGTNSLPSKLTLFFGKHLKEHQYIDFKYNFGSLNVANRMNVTSY